VGADLPLEDQKNVGGERPFSYFCARAMAYITGLLGAIRSTGTDPALVVEKTLFKPSLLAEKSVFLWLEIVSVFSHRELLLEGTLLPHLSGFSPQLQIL